MTESTQLNWEGITGGVVHALPEDLGSALRVDAHTLDLWESLTPLGRNEFICWVTDAKKAKSPSPAHSPNPGRARRGEASPVLLARVQTPRAHRPRLTGRIGGCGRLS